MRTSTPHPATLPDDELLKTCTVRRTRRSGPGGQHRNKTETAVLIEHEPTGVTGEAGERRRAVENQRRALFRLRLNLALAVRTAGAAEQPSELWRSRCHGGIVRVNPHHRDYPVMLAEALDVAGAEDWDIKAAAQRLQCSVSQLVKLLRREPRALATVNDERAGRGLHPLR
jgi:hypothetical protein